MEGEEIEKSKNRSSSQNLGSKGWDKEDMMTEWAVVWFIS